MNRERGESRISFSALLLAGGESQRMGRDKATMEFRGKPMWQRQIETLYGVTPEKIFVSARKAPAWLPDDCELILDDPPSRGPLSGLVKALTAIKTTHLLVLAVDMPFVTPAALRSLCSSVGRVHGVVPAIGERVEPLAAIYPAQAAPIFETALAGSDYALQSLIRHMASAGMITLLSMPDAELYRSLNRPGHLEQGSGAS
ncbi:MAG TPA: molybdenum cofactor guanylyltransferase [Chthoniobacterales bacterium]|jgi:molybdopterin-guanine dinucleotide biosynthesis protein A|nr:molybdenum cofactor guanylyltransferase [Chthoniobacterales bacterium]